MDNMQDLDTTQMPATTSASPVAPPSPQRDQYEKLEEMVKTQGEKQGVSDTASEVAGLLSSLRASSDTGKIIGMAKGGIASLADKVESKGRKGDTMLVHMAPEEVRGLQYLALQHGGSLTINPETGLVEANFLKSILPVIAGAALAPFTGGASMAALLVGGGTALATGSLEKGLMAGLGAFGGASLAGTLSATGAATTAGQTITPQIAQQTAITAQPVVAGVSPYALSAGTAPAAGMGLGGGLSTTAAAAPVTQVAGAITPAAAPVTYGNMSAGIKALGTEAGRSSFMTAAGGPTGLATKVVAPLAAGSLFSAEEPQGAGIRPQEYVRPYAFDFNRADTDPAFRYRTGAPGESTAEQRYFTPEFTALGTFKSGTEPGPSVYGTPTADLYNLYSKPKLLAAGGIAGLKKGRFLEDKTDSTGNSDGMSDSFPAVINNEQPARLTDGEFVVPADVVSHLGNGSSKAGAKRLHNMMDRIRAARTGTKKQAPAVKAEKFMPA